MVAVEGDLMNVGGESVGVVAGGVFDLAEDPSGWRVGECLGHLACALFEERLKASHALADAGLAVGSRCGHGGVESAMTRLAEGDLLHQQ